MSKKKILLVTNTPFSMSSYGVVARNMIKAMPSYEWYVLSRQWRDPRMIFKSGNVPYLLIPSAEGDLYGFNSFLREVERVEPDCIITKGDIGIQYGYAMQIHKSWKGKKLNWLAYTPIDSDWLNSELVDNLKKISTVGTIVAMSKFGKKVIEELAELKVPMVYHGVDLETFHPISLTERAKIRKEMGLTGKFVVFTNSNNQQRKQLPKLIEAFGKANIKNKFLILHTDMVPSSQFGGIEIVDYVKLLGLNKSVALTQRDQYPGWRSEWTDARMNEMYNVSDVFIFNGCEGFGLPVLESQATNTPVVAGDNTTMPELVPKNNLVKRGSWDYSTRTRYGVIDIDAMARKLEEISKSKISQLRVCEVGNGWTWEEVCKGWKKLI